MKKLESIIELLGSDKAIYISLKYVGVIMFIIGLFNAGLLLLSLGFFAGMLIIGKPKNK